MVEKSSILTFLYDSESASAETDGILTEENEKIFLQKEHRRTKIPAYIAERIPAGQYEIIKKTKGY